VLKFQITTIQHS